MGGQPAKALKKRIEFQPKRELLFSIKSDLPYFYKGFFADQFNRELDKVKQGIGVSVNFIICADAADSKTLIIKLKKNVTCAVSLHYNGQSVIINTNEFEDVSFNTADTIYHQFTAEPLGNASFDSGKIAYVQQILIH
jgi:hypothetical protein